MRYRTKKKENVRDEEWGLDIFVFVLYDRT